MRKEMRIFLVLIAIGALTVPLTIGTPNDRVIGAQTDRIDSKDLTIYENLGTTTFTVISPNGGENWQAGSNQIIKWSYTGDPGPNAKIELLKSLTDNNVISITLSTPKGVDGIGSYSWPIPQDLPTGAYLVKVTSTTDSIYSDTSDAHFSIIPRQVKIAYVPIILGELGPLREVPDTTHLEHYADKVDEYYNQQSYGKIDMTHDFLLGIPRSDRYGLLRLDKSLEEYKSLGSYDETLCKDVTNNDKIKSKYPTDSDGKPTEANKYSDLVIITAERIRGVAPGWYKEMHCAIVNDQGTNFDDIYGIPIVPEGLGYGMWAHEIGHAEFDFEDAIPVTDGGIGNVGYWDLMGNGWTLNPPAPISLFYKFKYQGWIPWNDAGIGTYDIRFIDDPEISKEGGLRYKVSDNEYYIFEGRNPPDKVSNVATRQLTGVVQGELLRKEEIMVYKVSNNREINYIKNEKGDEYTWPPAPVGKVTYRPTLEIGETTNKIPGVIVKALKENGKLKIKIENSGTTTFTAKSVNE